MSINQLVNELKENNQDFEFYPTTKEMVKAIYYRLEHKSNDILDIGCGTCNFKKFFAELHRENDASSKPSIGKYFVIEKSKILIDKLDRETIVLGTDFNQTLLIDKKADIYFCNPPYSEFEHWTCEILKNGNCKMAYLIIPQRWKENENINLILNKFDIRYKILGSFDFLNAERSARAKVDVIEFDKRKYSSRYGYYNNDLKDFNENAFDDWFNETFKMRDSSHDNKYEYEIEKEEIETIKNQIVNSDSKGKMLVELYNNEQNKFFEHFKAICSLDVDVLETIGVKKEAVKEALKQKVKSLKTKYWKIVFDEFEEITSRLTEKTRNDMFNRFQELQTIDFTLENIYPLILWIIKNANEYYNDQLIDFFKDLSCEENVKNYKSNQKVFKRDDWYYTKFRDENRCTHYVLDYRIIMSSPFRTDYAGRFDGLKWDCKHRLQDIFTIAKNLGFNPQKYPTLPDNFGQKRYVYYECSDKPFMTYRAYKNGNMHVKFDVDFIKALNVEVSRLLGWIRSKEDIKKEFPAEMAKGAEKYFKTNYTCLTSNSLKLLTTQRKPKFEHISNEAEQVILIKNPYKECLQDILNNIDEINSIDESNEEFFEKCLNILNEEKGFIYRNCLITKQEQNTKIEFRETQDFNKFQKQINRGIA